MSMLSLPLPSLRYTVLAFHEAIRPDLRPELLNKFLAPVAPGSQPMVMVCTDRTSRGGVGASQGGGFTGWGHHERWGHHEVGALMVCTDRTS